MSASGYSGTPLWKKLGFKTHFVIKLVDAPAHYFDLLHDVPEGLKWRDDVTSEIDIIHIFAHDETTMAKHIKRSRSEIKQNGMIWVSWPKKASKVPTDITEDVVRKAAFANALVDVKVCAVDKVWSGLKLMIRVKDRK